MSIPSKIRNKRRMLVNIASIEYITRGTSQYSKGRKRNERYKDWETKSSILSNRIMYIELIRVQKDYIIFPFYR